MGSNSDCALVNGCSAGNASLLPGRKANLSHVRAAYKREKAGCLSLEAEVAG